MGKVVVGMRVSVDGFVAAKGTVNSLEQLDGLVALGSARMEHASA